MARNSLPATQVGSKMGHGCAFLFGAVWILGWSAITLVFDGMLLLNGYQQLAALSYPTAPTEITHSEAKRADGDADSTQFEVRYKFSVAGREFVGDKRRYNEMGSNLGAAEKAAKEFPVGRKTTAYYNPRDPRDAVLSPGILAEDLFFALFLTPFNLIMLGGWAFAWSYFRGGRIGSPVAGLKVIDQGSDVTVRMPEISAIIVAAVALGAAAFVMIFVVAFSGLFNSLQAILIIWTIIFGLTGVAYAKAAGPVWRGAKDLRIDFLARNLSLPQTFGRSEPVEVALEKVTGVAVEHHRLSSKLRSSSSPNAVTLYYRNESGSTDAARLVEFNNKVRAEAFADWLREKLAKKV